MDAKEDYFESYRPNTWVNKCHQVLLNQHKCLFSIQQIEFKGEARERKQTNMFSSQREKQTE